MNFIHEVDKVHSPPQWVSTIWNGEINTFKLIKNKITLVKGKPNCSNGWIRKKMIKQVWAIFLSQSKKKSTKKTKKPNLLNIKLAPPALRKRLEIMFRYRVEICKNGKLLVTNKDGKKTVYDDIFSFIDSQNNSINKYDKKEKKLTSFSNTLNMAIDIFSKSEQLDDHFSLLEKLRGIGKQIERTHGYKNTMEERRLSKMLLADEIDFKELTNMLTDLKSYLVLQFDKVSNGKPFIVKRLNFFESELHAVSTNLEEVKHLLKIINNSKAGFFNNLPIFNKKIDGVILELKDIKIAPFFDIAEKAIMLLEKTKSATSVSIKKLLLTGVNNILASLKSIERENFNPNNAMTDVRNQKLSDFDFSIKELAQVNVEKVFEYANLLLPSMCIYRNGKNIFTKPVVQVAKLILGDQKISLEKICIECDSKETCTCKSS